MSTEDDDFVIRPLRVGDDGPCETHFDEAEDAVYCGRPSSFGHYNLTTALAARETEPERNPPAASRDLSFRCCRPCYAKVMRNLAAAEQEVSFEKDHGYPPNVSLDLLRSKLKTREDRLQRILKLDAPKAIIAGERRLIAQQRARIEAYLREHPTEA